MKTETIVGVDIGGTSISAGCIVNKKIIRICSCPTGADRSAGQILKTLYEIIERVLLPDTSAIGIGVPGLLNAESGEIINITNIPAWKNLPLKQKLEEHFKLPVYINNDANCFALGEKHFGKGQKYKNMVAISLGTGVGAGIIINNKIHSGLFGGAGEIGCWPYLDENFEAYCGSFFFQKKHTTGSEQYQKAITGDPHALQLFHEFGRHLGKLIKNIVFILAPEAIILGGSISQSFPLFEAGIQDELADFPIEVMKNAMIIEQSMLDDIAILGAAGLYYNA